MSHRLLHELGVECRDEFGFLDRSRTPRTVAVDAIFSNPATWIEAYPWLGKTTLARDLERCLRSDRAILGDVRERTSRVELGDPDASRELLPPWWSDWSDDPDPGPAVWILDGLDEAQDREPSLLGGVVDLLGRLSESHRAQLRLILFTRPDARHGESHGFRERLSALYPRHTASGLREYALARLDRAAAERLVGEEALARILPIIEENHLKELAGLPVILLYLKNHLENVPADSWSLWKGVLQELLGRSRRDLSRPFTTSLPDRFEATGRLAAALTLMRRETVRDFSDRDNEPTIGSIFGGSSGADRLQRAAEEACRTAAFQGLAERKTFRFAYRNIQDWFTAFFLESLSANALTSALSDGTGGVLPGLREAAKLLQTAPLEANQRAVIDRILVDDLLPSASVEPSLAQAIVCLDRLEALARDTPWGLRFWPEERQEFRRLAAPGLAGVLASRLSDASRPWQVKQFLLTAARQLRAMEVVDPVIRLLLDDEENESVREDAAYLLCDLGGDAHLESLPLPLSTAESAGDLADRLNAPLILELWERGLWTTAQAALAAPAAAGRIGNRRADLESRLVNHLTLEDARSLLPHLGVLFDRHRRDMDSPRNRLPEVVLALIIEQEPLPRQDAELLLAFAKERLISLMDGERWQVADRFISRLHRIPACRRELFRWDAERVLRGEPANYHVRALLPDDWAWLRDQARGPLSELPDIWAMVVNLAEQAKEQAQLDEAGWESLTEEVEQRDPGFFDRREEARRRFDAESREHRERIRRLEAESPSADWPPPRPIVAIIEDLLEGCIYPDSELVWRLGFACFHSDLDHGIEGTWHAVPEDLQERVLDALKSEIRRGSPHPPPEGTSLNAAILGESAAFDRLVRSQDADSWLTGEIIATWLPAALHGTMTQDWADLIRPCWARDPDSTETALLKVIPEQVERFDPPLQLARIPSECWTASVASLVIELFQDDRRPLSTRGELLILLAARGAEEAAAFARRWLGGPTDGAAPDPLQLAARNVSLVHDPAAVFDLIADEPAESLADRLKELSGLFGDRDELRVDWTAWPTDLRERLAMLLLRAVPYSLPHPETLWGNNPWDLRARVIHTFEASPDPRDEAALERLMAIDDDLRNLVATRRASAWAHDLVSHLDPGEIGDLGGLPLATVRRLFDSKDFRLIRSSDDLMHAILEALPIIQKEFGDDRPLLYGPPRRGNLSTPKSSRKSTDESPRKHLEEDALQAYIHRRLKDILRKMDDKIEVHFAKEPEVKYRHRYDLDVTAPCLGSRALAKVVIEIKWSSNEETKSALVEQLGRKYLVDEGRTHGIFLVGWSEFYSPGDGRGRCTEIQVLRQSLIEQRDEYIREGQPGHRLRIEPYVLDLQWKSRVDS